MCGDVQGNDTAGADRFVVGVRRDDQHPVVAAGRPTAYVSGWPRGAGDQRASRSPDVFRQGEANPPRGRR
jgi:hypothetical protein